MKKTTTGLIGTTILFPLVFFLPTLESKVISLSFLSLVEGYFLYPYFNEVGV